MNNSKLTPIQILQITNILRSLGFNISHIGTKLLNKSIQYILINNIEFFKLEEIYMYLHTITGFNIETIKSNINKAIYNRKIEISKKNFKNMFGFEYDEYYFSNKKLIEEILNILLQ